MSNIVKVDDFIPMISMIEEVVTENIGRPLELNDLERWIVPGGGGTSFQSSYDGETKEIECIIMAKREEKRFYADKELDGKRPDCYSLDMKQGIGNPGMLCSECPHNQFIDSSGKDCKDRMEIVFLKKGDMIPSRISLPTMSIKPFKTYLLSLTSKGKLYKNVVTKMSLVKDKNSSNVSYSKLKFEAIGMIEGHAEAMAHLAISDIR